MGLQDYLLLVILRNVASDSFESKMQSLEGPSGWKDGLHIIHRNLFQASLLYMSLGTPCKIVFYVKLFHEER